MVSTGQSGQSVMQKVVDVDWKSLVPKVVPSEDALGQKACEEIWSLIYTGAGLVNPSEKERQSVRLAVYAYGCKNGTSREGSYSGVIVTSGGLEFEAAVIPRSTGKYHIRKFFRGNMQESYVALKTSKVMEGDPRFVAKVEGYGISSNNAFATADWLADCPMFTPEEVAAHNAVQKYSLERARRVRGGNDLETVENVRIEDGLKVSGPLETTGSHVW